GLDRVGLLMAEDGGPVVLVALRIAAGDANGPRRAGGVRDGGAPPVQEVEQVVSVRAGRIEAQDEQTPAAPRGDRFEALAELAIAAGRLREGQCVGGRLEVVAQEGGAVAVARGVDADAETARRLWEGRMGR